jgi:DNA-binding SARP family transcriptional activator/TolB-like protein/tetratricopeptide (TPR) repeat protein
MSRSTYDDKAQIRLQALGTLGVWRHDGTEVRSLVQQPKRLALLLYLVMAAPRGQQRRDNLIALFWPEYDTERARHALSQAAHVLRRSLGPEILDRRGDEDLGVSAEMVWCDVVAFEAACARADWQSAVQLYRGDVAAGFFVPDAPGFEQWLEGERARLRALASQACRTLLERAWSAGNSMAGVRWAREALRIVPTDEVALRRLMHLQAALGDRAGALEEYAVFSRRMREEYGLEPDIATESIAQSLRDGALMSEPKVSSTVAAAAPVKDESVISPVAPADLLAAITHGPEAPARTPGWKRRTFALQVLMVLVVIASVLMGAAFLQRRADDASSAAGSAARPVTRVAVLDFDRTGAGDIGYLADGINDALVDQLGASKGVRAVARQALRKFRGSSVPPDSVARAVHANWVVDGRVVSDGNRVRLTLEFIDAATGAVVRSKRFEQPRGEPFALMDDMAAEVSEFVRREIGSATRTPLWRARTRNVRAWEAFSRARDVGRLWTDKVNGTDHDVVLERSLLLRADSLYALAGMYDPGWADPLLQRSWVAGNLGWMEVRERGPLAHYSSGPFLRAIDFAERAVSMDTTYALAFEKRGLARLFLWDLATPDGVAADTLIRAAERDFQKALALQPNLPVSESRLAVVFSREGKWAEAHAVAQAAYEDDAYREDGNQIVLTLLDSSFQLGQLESARRWCKEFNRREPGRFYAIECQVKLLALAEGDPRAALRELARLDIAHALPNETPSMRRTAEAALALATIGVLTRAGLRDSALRTIRRAHDASKGNAFIPWFEVRARVQVGQLDSAIDLMRKPMLESPKMRLFIRADRSLQPLHDLPAFRALVGLPVLVSERRP